MQRTIVVEHEGTYEASPQQIGSSLFHSLKDEGLTRSGDYKVVDFVNVAGQYTKFTLEFDVEPKPAKAKK